MSFPSRQATVILPEDASEPGRSTPLPLSSLSQGTLDRLLECIPSGTVDAISEALGDATNPSASDFRAEEDTCDMPPYSLQIETRAVQFFPPSVHTHNSALNDSALNNSALQVQSKTQTNDTQSKAELEQVQVHCGKTVKFTQVYNTPLNIYKIAPQERVTPIKPQVCNMSEYPSNTPYPGPHQFEIFLTKAQESESKKTISYIYSQEENKLYVRMRVHCPVHFRVSTPPPDGSHIRAMVIYSRPQDVGDVVKRCMNHTMEDKESMDHPDHLVRCHNRSAIYEELGPCKRHSVSFPWECPSAGSDYISGIYEFMCFSSCSGTINRRPTQLLFTLEHRDEVIGRAMIELRICACPGRDIVLSENQVVGSNPIGQCKRKIRTTSPLGSGTPVSASPSPTSAGRNGGHANHNLIDQFTSVEPIAKRSRDEEVYNVQVRGRELYKIVMTIVKNYECARQYEQIVNAFQGQVPPPLPVESCAGKTTTVSSTTNGSIFPFENKPAHHTNGQSSNKTNGNEADEMTHFASLMPDTVAAHMKLADWLDSHDLGHFVDSFTEHGLRTMDDLSAVLSMDLLEKLGLPLEDRERLYSAFIQWRSMSTQLSSLSSYSSLNGSTSTLDSLAALGGLRLARTTIRSSIKMPRKPKLTLGGKI